MSALTRIRGFVAAAARDEAVLAAFAALWVTALVELARVPLRAYAHDPALLLGVYALSTRHLLVDLAPAVLYVPLVALARHIPRPRIRGVLVVLLALLAAGFVYRSLVLYPDFARHPATWVALAALFVNLAAASLLPHGARFDPRRVALALATIQLTGAVASHALDTIFYKGDYPTLHLSLLVCAQLTLALGIWHVLRLLSPRPDTVGRPALARGLLAASCVLVPALITPGPLRAHAEPYFRAYATLGQAQTLFHPYHEENEPTRSEPLLDEAPALARFARDSALPALPQDFDLTRYNVLMVVSETMRFDQTSLANPGLGTTPALSQWSARGGLTFTHAYAPSSGTFQSMAAVLQMSYPSFIDLEVWSKPWQGRLRDRSPSVAELFDAAGYHTFWNGHNNAKCFEYTVLGFDRGFDDIDLITSKQSASVTADSRILRKAQKSLERVAQTGERFFGWVFFVSPHAQYNQHYPEMPAETELDLYRQEVRYVDEQFGKLMSKLERLRLLETTIVIFFGDHGEEFREHGGTHHKATLYNEVVRVPLAVWVPGLSARTIDAPISTMYVLPWLLLRGDDGMRAAASMRIRRDIAPVQERTQGAVLVELLGPDRMRASLVYTDWKYNYDFVANLYEAYSMAEDPLEQDDRLFSEPGLAAEVRERFGGYRAMRAARKSFELRRDKKDPRPWKQKKKKKKKR